MFDLALSLKEAALIIISLFSALVLVQGMSARQSLRYTFNLKDKEALDTLRQGTAGPIGPDFDIFITRIESIVFLSNFTKKERLDRLTQLAEIQKMKEDSIALFLSAHSLYEYRMALKNAQERAAVGLLRELDSSRQALATEIYTSYLPWRRVNIIRTLIYSHLSLYLNRGKNTPYDQVLFAKEQWSSRKKHRQKINKHWQRFKDHLTADHAIKAPDIPSASALMLKLSAECDDKASPHFSRELNSLHSKLCLLSFLSSLVSDLYAYHHEGQSAPDMDTERRAISKQYAVLTLDLLSNILDYSKTILNDAESIMRDIHTLISPRSYWDIRPSFFT